MQIAKKLIEVAMPIKEISAESVRDKSIRHGHISTLHLWWARRPLPVSRAIVFASLVPDPLDALCPQAFKSAVDLLLGANANGADPYKPYEDIPYTAAQDKLQDNTRNRLLMFIGKFSDEFCEDIKNGKTTATKDLLAAASLIKWDNKNDANIIGIARKLLWVAHNAQLDSSASAQALLQDFERHYSAIAQAEEALYSFCDRHTPSEQAQALQQALQQAIEAFLDKMPRVFDPFAGGGAIPLEAARLGCRSFGNDINPVAHIIQKASLEFPQRFGKPITYSVAEFTRIYGEKTLQQIPNEQRIYQNGDTIAIRIANRLSFDVEHFAQKLLARTEEKIGHLYPKDPQGNTPIAYYWARTATCSNPSCRAEVPLLKGFYLANTHNKKVYLQPIINGTDIQFDIKTNGEPPKEGWNLRANLKCPCCGSFSDTKTIKAQFLNGTSKERILAVIWDSKEGKQYKLPSAADLEILDKIPKNAEKPTEKMPTEYTQAMPACTWGIKTWGDMFSPRQLCALHALVAGIQELKPELQSLFGEDYAKAVATYLGVLMDRVAVANTAFGVWHTGRETLERIMGRQAIPMVFDYPESNPFCNASGSAANQLEWITRYIESEGAIPFITTLQHASSGDKSQFEAKYLDAVVTDPPYYDAIAYADLSDFFYVWLKRSLGDMYPLNFSTPQTPKTEECTALKHHHDNSKESAKAHFERKMLEIFGAIEHQTRQIVSIMFAHQTTEAWTTLCNSILGAGMNITGSWAVDTEMTGALKTDKAFLSSSVTVSARPAQRVGIGAYKSVRRAVEERVAAEVEALYALGFRGADLLTACFGKAVSEFGQYAQVERADGRQVSVAELLELARESAFSALLRGFEGDDYTRFYIGWLQLYGFAESDFDDAAKFTKIGLSINVQDLFNRHLFVKTGNTQILSDSAQRLAADKALGEHRENSLIDCAHRAMQLYKGSDRNALLSYIRRVGSSAESVFWRVLTVLKELLPPSSADYEHASGLLAQKDSLLRESKKEAENPNETQTILFTDEQ